MRYGLPDLYKSAISELLSSLDQLCSKIYVDWELSPINTPSEAGTAQTDTAAASQLTELEKKYAALRKFKFFPESDFSEGRNLGKLTAMRTYNVALAIFQMFEILKESNQWLPTIGLSYTSAALPEDPQEKNTVIENWKELSIAALNSLYPKLHLFVAQSKLLDTTDHSWVPEITDNHHSRPALELFFKFLTVINSPALKTDPHTNNIFSSIAKIPFAYSKFQPMLNTAEYRIQSYKIDRLLNDITAQQKNAETLLMLYNEFSHPASDNDESVNRYIQAIQFIVDSEEKLDKCNCAIQNITEILESGIMGATGRETGNEESLACNQFTDDELNQLKELVKCRPPDNKNLIKKIFHLSPNNKTELTFTAKEATKLAELTEQIPGLSKKITYNTTQKTRNLLDQYIESANSIKKILLNLKKIFPNYIHLDTLIKKSNEEQKNGNAALTQLQSDQSQLDFYTNYLAKNFLPAYLAINPALEEAIPFYKQTLYRKLMFTLKKYMFPEICKHIKQKFEAHEKKTREALDGFKKRISHVKDEIELENIREEYTQFFAENSPFDIRYEVETYLTQHEITIEIIPLFQEKIEVEISTLQEKHNQLFFSMLNEINSEIEQKKNLFLFKITSCDSLDSDTLKKHIENKKLILKKYSECLAVITAQHHGNQESALQLTEASKKIVGKYLPITTIQTLQDTLRVTLEEESNLFAEICSDFGSQQSITDENIKTRMREHTQLIAEKKRSQDDNQKERKNFSALIKTVSNAFSDPSQASFTLALEKTMELPDTEEKSLLVGILETHLAAMTWSWTYWTLTRNQKERNFDTAIQCINSLSQRNIKAADELKFAIKSLDTAKNKFKNFLVKKRQIEFLKITLSHLIEEKAHTQLRELSGIPETLPNETYQKFSELTEQDIVYHEKLYKSACFLEECNLQKIKITDTNIQIGTLIRDLQNIDKTISLLDIKKLQGLFTSIAEEMKSLLTSLDLQKKELLPPNFENYIVTIENEVQKAQKEIDAKKEQYALLKKENTRIALVLTQGTEAPKMRVTVAGIYRNMQLEKVEIYASASMTTEQRDNLHSRTGCDFSATVLENCTFKNDIAIKHPYFNFNFNGANFKNTTFNEKDSLCGIKIDQHTELSQELCRRILSDNMTEFSIDLDYLNALLSSVMAMPMNQQDNPDTAITTDLILKILKGISSAHPINPTMSAADQQALLQAKKQRAIYVVEKLVMSLSDKEALKLGDTLVNTKHDGEKNPYAYIRQERDRFRCAYGNTKTWQTIMTAVKKRLSAINTNTLEPAQYKKHYKTMKTHVKHDYGFGLFPCRKPSDANTLITPTQQRLQ